MTQLFLRFYGGVIVILVAAAAVQNFVTQQQNAQHNLQVVEEALGGGVRLARGAFEAFPTVPQDRMLAIVQEQARVYKLQEKPPPSVALLRRRAAADVELVERALKSEGYYEGAATITVDAEARKIPTGDEPETGAAVTSRFPLLSAVQ